MTLFTENTTDFTTNGIGQLADAISCYVEEKRNGSYELEMVYPVDGIHFSDIKHSRFITAKPADGKAEQPFRIYKIKKPMNGKVKIKAEHNSYRLSHIPVSPFSATTLAEAFMKLKSNAVEDCPFEFWTDKSSTGNFEVTEPASIRSRLGGVRGSILDIYGGEYEFDNYTVKLHSARGSDRGVTLRYGKNILDIDQEENIQNTVTGVYPFWKGTDDNDGEQLVELDEKVLHSSNAANFPFQRTIPLDLSEDFENPPTQAQLRARARAYMTANNVGVPHVSIKVSFLPLWQTEEYKDALNLERVNLCDTVTIAFEKLDVQATAKVVRTKFNVLADRYDEIELGDAKSGLGEALKNDISGVAEISTSQVKDAKSELRKAIKHATKLITVGLGGYVVFGQNANGEPEEIFIMDKPSVETAVNIIRINKNGIGFSTNGYSGPYANAWTIDGHLVADFITTGTLTAVLIKAGILSDVKGKNYWNMETGEFQLASTATIGGKTATQIADDAVEAQTQQSIFNKLTNNGQTQGIYLSGGKLYINGTYIQTGTITIKKGSKTTFSANADTGVVNIVADSFSLSDGSTIDSIAENKASAAVSAQTQQSIFNKLTNNGQTQGIYLSGGKVYINASYIATGTLADADENTVFNLSTGSLTMKKGSINIGNGTFKVTTTGALTATSATITGTVKSEGSDAWCKLVEGSLIGAANAYSTSSENGYISFNQYYTNTGSYGTRIAGRGMVALMSPVIAVGGYVGRNSSASAWIGVTKTYTLATGIADVEVKVKPEYDYMYKVARVYVDDTGTYLANEYYESVGYVKNVSVTVNVTPSTTKITFNKGLMTSE